MMGKTSSSPTGTLVDDLLGGVTQIAEHLGETGKTSSSSLADDLLRGVAQIAEHLGESRKRTYCLCERGYIPSGKIGSAWIASKTTLRAHFEKITAPTRGV